MKKTLFISAVLASTFFVGCTNKEGDDLGEAKKHSLNVEEAMKVNSLELIQAFQKDRSLAHEKYGNKSLLITDLLVFDIYIPESSLQKMVRTIPYNHSNNTIAIDFTNYNPYKFNNKDLISTDQEADIYFSISNEDLKNANLLDYEGISNRNFTKKIDVYGVIGELDYKANGYIDNNISTGYFNITLEDVVIK